MLFLIHQERDALSVNMLLLMSVDFSCEIACCIYAMTLDILSDITVTET